MRTHLYIKRSRNWRGETSMSKEGDVGNRQEFCTVSCDAPCESALEYRVETKRYSFALSGKAGEALACVQEMVLHVTATCRTILLRFQLTLELNPFEKSLYCIAIRISQFWVFICRSSTAQESAHCTLGGWFIARRVQRLPLCLQRIPRILWEICFQAMS